MQLYWQQKNLGKNLPISFLAFFTETCKLSCKTNFFSFHAFWNYNFTFVFLKKLERNWFSYFSHWWEIFLFVIETHLIDDVIRRNVLQLIWVAFFNLDFLFTVSWLNFITEDRMLRNTYLYENRMFTNKVKTTSFGVGKEKM